MSFRLFDAHCDTAFEIWKRKEGLARNTCHVALDKASSFDAYAQIFAFCSYAGAAEDMKRTRRDLLILPLERLRQEVRKNSERIAFACNSWEVEACAKSRKIAALLSVEGPEVIDCDPEGLWELKNEGFIMTTLTWNADNALAGCHTSEKGLTEQGSGFVKEAQRLGILIDVSHLSDKAFWDLADMTQRPILASHSNCRQLCGHSRNLTDEQLRVIAQTGGVVGLNLYVPFLGEGANFETLRRHLEHMLRLCGEKQVCLGGDLDGCDLLPTGFSSLADYTNFCGYLQNCGYSKPLLDDIFYNNLLRLL